MATMQPNFRARRHPESGSVLQHALSHCGTTGAKVLVLSTNTGFIILIGNDNCTVLTFSNSMVQILILIICIQLCPCSMKLPPL